MTRILYHRHQYHDTASADKLQELQALYPESELLIESEHLQTKMNARPVLDNILEQIEAGDRLVVWQLESLGSSLSNLHDIVQHIINAGASLLVIEQKIDTATPTGKVMMKSLLEVFSQYDEALKRERRQLGQARRKNRGLPMGRPKSINTDKIKKLREEGKSPTEIARQMKIGRASVYRILKSAD